VQEEKIGGFARAQGQATQTEDLPKKEAWGLKTGLGHKGSWREEGWIRKWGGGKRRTAAAEEKCIAVREKSGAAVGAQRVGQIGTGGGGTRRKS